MDRKDQKIEDTWDLSSLVKDEKSWEKDMKKLAKRIPEIKALKGTLGASSDAFHNALVTFEDIMKEAERLGSYAFLCYSVDSMNPAVAERAGRFEALENEMSEAAAFFDPELFAIDEAQLNEWISEKRNKPYRIWLQKSLRFKEHTLSENEEKLLSLYSPVGAVFQDAFFDLNNIDLDFGEINGEKLTHGTYAKFIRSEDENIRRQAYKQLYGEFDKHAHTIARLYGGQIKADIFSAKARGYNSCIEKALFPDQVPVKVYKNLIKTIHEAFPVLHRFYEIKAKTLGKDKLKHYDVYMPMTQDVTVHYDYDQAVEIIKEAVKPLGEEYQKTIVAGLTTERWADKYENRGKRSGAFSAGCYTGNPFIMTNYEPTVLDSVFTLIHEGGHSMHSWYSVHNNPFMSYNYTIFEAETASTFNEQLLMHYLLNTIEDKKVEKYLVSKALDDLVATLFRQTMFAEYEMIVHEAAEKGVPMTLEFLRTTYGKLLKEYFGPALEFEPESDLEGLRIPHFYRSFYVYKYATGISGAIALSRRVLNGGEKERQDYLGFLKSGGSTYPIKSLKKAGVDMSKPDAIRAATQYFSELLDRFETL